MDNKYRLTYVPPAPHMGPDYEPAMVIYHIKNPPVEGPTPSSCFMLIFPYPAGLSSPLAYL